MAVVASYLISTSSPQHPGGHIQQLEAQVDAGAEIGAFADGDARRGPVDGQLLRLR